MSNLNLGLDMASLELGLKKDVISGVILHAGQTDSGETLDFTAGSTSGEVLEVTVPHGDQEMAQTILDGLKKRGFRYQPFTSGNTHTDPAVEIGDNVTVNGEPSVVMGIQLNHSRLMASTLKAPYEEELDHEFKYEPRTQREFKRESARTRARLSINEDSIVSEVVRASNNEKALGSRIEQRLNSISLSVTSENGESRFVIRDGSTQLFADTFDLTVKAVNVSGTLTASQIAAGAISIGKLDADAKATLVVSSSTQTQYYLSTSESSATGGSWADAMPTWTSGKYLWTREKTSNKFADNTVTSTYSPSESGRYDKNLTEALSTSAAAAPASNANKRTSTLYFSASGGNIPQVPTSWISDVSGDQAKWTLVRPEYSSYYPALYTIQQSETVSGTYTTTTPKLDATTTVIDGSHIITGTIDATKLYVEDLSALNATIGGWAKIGGWEIHPSYLSKQTDTSRVLLYTDNATTDTTNAISVAVRASTSDPWVTKFGVTYGGKVTCTDADISGRITATSGTIGGVTIANGVLTGITGTNIASSTITGGNIAGTTITGGEYGNLALSTITTNNTVSGINTNLGYASLFGAATAYGTNVSPNYFTVGYQLNIGTAGNGMLVYKGASVQLLWSDVLGTYYLGSFGEG